MTDKTEELKKEIEKLSKVTSNALNFEEVIREQKYKMGELKGRTDRNREIKNWFERKIKSTIKRSPYQQILIKIKTDLKLENE